MATVGGNNQVAALMAQVQSLMGQAGVAGGGAAAGAPGTTPATTAAANTASTTTAGIVSVQAQTLRGTTVTVTKDLSNGKYKLTPNTGLDERVTVDGKSLLFDGNGEQVTNYQIASRQPIKVELDRRVGISSGISNLSRIVSQRQERIKQLQEALAQDSNETNAVDQLNLQHINMEATAVQHLSEINKKIFDTVESAIGVWTR